MLEEIASGAVDCVLNLGAGLDARPWRLPLPTALRWIEVDFAPILPYKYGMLHDVAPRCVLERIIADVSAQAELDQVLETAMGRGQRVLLLTEGLLFYLAGDVVRHMVRAAGCCQRSILDAAPNTSLLLPSGGHSMRQADKLRHETRLEGAEILQVIRHSGWTPLAGKTFMKDGGPFAIERMRRNGWGPDPEGPRPAPDDPAGVWLFRETQTA